MFLLCPSILPWALHLAMASRRGRLRERPVIAVAGAGVGVDAADFDSPLGVRVEQSPLSSSGSRRSMLHVERHRAPLRSTGRGAASATRLEASMRTFGDVEDSRDPCLEAMCQRARLSF